MVNPKKVASDPNRPWLSCQKWGDPPKMRKNHLDHRFVQSKSAVQFWSDPILDIHQQTLLYECNLIKNRDSCQLLGSNRHELIQPLFLFNAIFKTYCGFGLLLVEGLFSIVSSQFMSSYEARFKKNRAQLLFSTLLSMSAMSRIGLGVGKSWIIDGWEHVPCCTKRCTVCICNVMYACTACTLM